MKILQVSNRVPWPLDEGGNIGIYNFTRAFSKLGHDVTLYCLDGLKHKTPVRKAKFELSKYATVFIHPIDTDVKFEEAVKHLLRNESYNVSRFYNSVFEQELKTLLCTEKFDVVQLEGTFVGPYISTIRKHHTGLLSLRMHNVEYEIWQRLAINEKNPVKKLYIKKLASQLKKYEEKILQEVDVIVPVTDDDGTKFKKLNPLGEYITIPAGIDLEEWQFMPSKSFTNWYHIGSMEWHANTEAVDWFLKDIHNSLVSLDDKYILSLAGKGINGSQFTDHASLEVNENVPVAFDFVKRCDVCVVPLKSGSGIRLKILEAMAAGKLVISTTIGAQGIDYKANEHLLIADSPRDYIEIYKSLANGSIDQSSIVINARKLIEANYSTEALAQKQLNMYEPRVNTLES